MKTLLVVPWDDEFGGVVSVAGNLARCLKGQGHEVLFFHPSQKTLFIEEQTTKWGFPGFKLSLGRPFTACHPALDAIVFFFLFPFVLYQIIRLINRHRIQIVNIHYPMPSYVYFAICRWVLPIKLVTSLHGGDIFPKRYPETRRSHALRFLLFSSDLIVDNSRAFQKSFLDVFPRLHAKTTFIHNGISLAELNGFGRDGADGDQDRYILCVAAHKGEKGIDVLIRALARLDNVDPPIKLILAGDGARRSQLEDLATSLGVHERTRFLGWQKRAEVVKLLHGCEAFVLPSRSEPFGIVVIEALACGKPVVASAIGGIPEIIDHGKNGILVEPDNPGALAEALMAILGNPKLGRTLGDNGYTTVEKHFRYEKTGAAYEAVFKDLVGLPAR